MQGSRDYKITGVATMDALDAISKRRSVRRFTSALVPKEDLEIIVDAARLAANGSNRQMWDFVVITERAMIEQFKSAGPWIAQAPAVIAVVLDPSTRWWVEDGAAAIENMLIAATALGYGSCWVEGDALPREAQYKELLGIPENKRLMALIPIGVATDWPVREKKSLEQVIHWEKY
jgi:nitroreductase